jgi:hypothetical protein
MTSIKNETGAGCAGFLTSGVFCYKVKSVSL